MPGKQIPIFICTVSIIILTACGPAILPVTSTPESTATSLPDDSPPPISIEIGGETQTGRLGSYCWTFQSENGDMGGACLDRLALPTPIDPIHSGSPVAARLSIPLDEMPTHLQLAIFEATEPNQAKLEGLPTTSRYWMSSDSLVQQLPLQNVQDITVELEPGLYVFSIFGNWESKGSAEYGFLVEVQ